MRASDSHDCPMLSFHFAKILNATVLVAAASALIEVIIGGIRNKRHVAEISQRGTACGWCQATMGVQPLNEGGPAKPVAAGRSILASNNRNQQPGDCPRLDEVGVAGGVTRIHLSPDRARVLRVLPCGTNRVITYHLWIGVYFSRVRTKIVGGELPTIITEQRSLGRKEYKPDARS